MSPPDVVLNQLNLAVRDVDATAAFYGRLGLEIHLAPDGRHAACRFANGVSLEFDSTSFVPEWDSGRRDEVGGGAIIGFSVDSREAVDDLYRALLSAGGAAHQTPYDAFWGARYAIVEDPDGYPLGLMSPIDRKWASWPPRRPPSPE